MDGTDRLLNVIMIIATVIMFIKGWLKGLDIIDLIFNNIYLIALILYLTKINLLEEK